MTQKAVRVRDKMPSMCDIHPVDCVKGMKKFVVEGTVDVVVTSPPYNIGKKYNQYNDEHDEQKFLGWMKVVSAEVKRVMKEDGSLFLNLGGKPSDTFWPVRVLDCFRHDFKLQNSILWVKSIAIEGEDFGLENNNKEGFSVGHYKPVNSDKYLNQMSEYIFHLTKQGNVPLDKLSIGVPYQDKSNVNRWCKGGGNVRDRGNVWFIPYETITKSRTHPCVFPLKLPKMCIKLHGLERTKLVMDPFLGTGTTAVASKDLEKDFVGFEIDPYYVRLARRAVCKGTPSTKSKRTEIVKRE
ncbi:MAG: site-specific DNA-methyltransferase [Candidatus Thermoplasmatota archaeon]|jgi:site-specific DNA-methyltransferase (adenine-specific)|nr:site-specific DNA-methyltransferase [Candidatus Thermoplasmatota archaeon]MCL5253392.1 site-specific DNA-methyltransferase [Candidatus Thermoplasmatota archaeon]